MKNLFKFDWIIFISVLLLLCLSLAALYPISNEGKNIGQERNHFFRQLFYILLGFAVFFLFSFFDYRNLRSYSTVLFLAGMVLLIAVLIFGKVIRGTSGWIKWGELGIQPVEFFKIVIAVLLAKYFSLHSRTLYDPRHIIFSIVPLAAALLLILLQPDLGSALVVLSIWLGVLLISGIKKRHLLTILLIGMIISAFSWGFLLKDYQKNRISTLLDPSSDPLGAGYNVIQSTVAVGSGGIWGKGLGHGSQSQLNFLPEKHTDFIFAVIAEELGFGGALFVVALISIILIRMIAISQKSRDNFGKLLAGSFAMLIFVQTVVNVGMNIGIMPVTGIPLPFLSYGGSAMVAMMMAMGITQSVHRLGKK